MLVDGRGVRVSANKKTMDRLEWSKCHYFTSHFLPQWFLTTLEWEIMFSFLSCPVHIILSYRISNIYKYCFIFPCISLKSEWPWKCLTISFCYFPIIFQYHQLQTISICDIGSLQMGSQLRAGFLDLKDGSERSLMLLCSWKITDRKFLIPTFIDDYTWLW